MEIKFTLALPRDELSVPVVRRILTAGMRVLGVEEQTIGDIELALTEACTNVLDHSAGEQEYEVSAGIDGTRCVIEVVDRGAVGFDGAATGHGTADVTAESGRGVQLMRALVDRVEFSSHASEGTVVHLEKQLVFPAGAVLHRLSVDNAPTEHGPWSEGEETTPR